jgi:hypothetical protein
MATDPPLLLAMAREHLPLPARLLLTCVTTALTGLLLYETVGYGRKTAAAAQKQRRASPSPSPSPPSPSSAAAAAADQNQALLVRRLAVVLPIIALNACLPLLFAFSPQEANFRALCAFVVAWHGSLKAAGLALGRGPLAERRWSRGRFVALYCFPVFPRRNGGGGGGGNVESGKIESDFSSDKNNNKADADPKKKKAADPPRVSAAGGRAADDAGGVLALAGGFAADATVLLVTSALALTLHAPPDLRPRWLDDTEFGQWAVGFMAERVAPWARAAMPSSFAPRLFGSSSGTDLSPAVLAIADAGALRALKMLAAVAALFTWVRLSMNAMGAAAVGCLGVRVAPPFDAPWKSRSLADFWGRRWNNSTGLLMRSLVFDAVLERRAEAREARYLLVERQEREAAVVEAAAAEAVAAAKAVVTTASPPPPPLLLLQPSRATTTIPTDGGGSDTIPVAFAPSADEVAGEADSRPLGAAARRVAALASADWSWQRQRQELQKQEESEPAVDLRAVIRLAPAASGKSAAAKQALKQAAAVQGQALSSSLSSLPPPPPPPSKGRQAAARLAAFTASALMHDAMIAYVPGCPLGWWSAFMLVQVPLMLAQDALEGRVTRWWRRRKAARQSGGGGGGEKKTAGAPLAAAGAAAEKEPMWLRSGRLLTTWVLLALTTHWLLWPPVIDQTDAVYRVIAGAHGVAEQVVRPLMVPLAGS